MRLEAKPYCEQSTLGGARFQINLPVAGGEGS